MSLLAINCFNDTQSRKVFWKIAFTEQRPTQRLPTFSVLSLEKLYKLQKWRYTKLIVNGRNLPTQLFTNRIMINCNDIK